MKDLTQDRKGSVQWVRLPKKTRLPGKILATTAKVYWPATGLLEERITLEELPHLTVVGQ